MLQSKVPAFSTAFIYKKASRAAFDSNNNREIWYPFDFLLPAKIKF